MIQNSHSALLRPEKTGWIPNPAQACFDSRVVPVCSSPVPSEITASLRRRRLARLWKHFHLDQGNRVETSQRCSVPPALSYPGLGVCWLREINPVRVRAGWNAVRMNISVAGLPLHKGEDSLGLFSLGMLNICIIYPLEQICRRCVLNLSEIFEGLHLHLII